MNIAESNDTNRVLRLLLRVLNAPGVQVPSGEDRDAAVRLADRACKALLAGLDGPKVAAAWPTNQQTGEATHP